MHEVRDGIFMPTWTGKRVYLDCPDPAQICIEDIAHSLSLQCRFAGHTNRFYSVAEHSVRVMLELGDGLRAPGLLHDAAEAYCVDLPRPIKRSLGMEAYVAIESRIHAAIHRRFNLVNLPLEARGLIQAVDYAVCSWEMIMLFDHSVFPPLNPGNTELVKVNTKDGIGWSPALAESAFLRWAVALGLA